MWRLNASHKPGTFLPKGLTFLMDAFPLVCCRFLALVRHPDRQVRAPVLKLLTLRGMLSDGVWNAMANQGHARGVNAAFIALTPGEDPADTPQLSASVRGALGESVNLPDSILLFSGDDGSPDSEIFVNADLRVLFDEVSVDIVATAVLRM